MTDAITNHLAGNSKRNQTETKRPKYNTENPNNTYKTTNVSMLNQT